MPGETPPAPVLAKLLPPRAHQLVPRVRVTQAISQALAGGVCWLAAPAGYGKTTALADHLRATGQATAWYRVDEGDGDIASWFHYLRQSPALGTACAAALPVYGAARADQPLAFARRFFRAWFAGLAPGTLVVLDDLHHAEGLAFVAALAVLLQEMPDSVQCACISRALPPARFNDLLLSGRMAIVDQAVLEFTADEAAALLRARGPRADVGALDTAAARGWAVGLMMLAQARIGWLEADGDDAVATASPMDPLFAALAQRLFNVLPPEEQQLLLRLSLLPEITPALAGALAEPSRGAALLARLHRRQLLTAAGVPARPVFRMHDLLRELLQERLARQLPPAARQAMQAHVAGLLSQAGQAEAAIELALRAEAWPLARRLLLAYAEPMLSQGRRATWSAWCDRMPPKARDGWTSYWQGVAHLGDDAVAEGFLAQAFERFSVERDARGQCRATAQAVLAKTGSWRTHEGLAVWTQRAAALAHAGLPALEPRDDLLVRAGLLRALDYGEDYAATQALRRDVAGQLLAALQCSSAGADAALRLLASESLIEHAGSAGDAALFEQAVDPVRDCVDDAAVRATAPWALGLWLVAFGAVSGRYFPYARRGFPHADAEAALRAAVALGRDEGLRGVEFGALYHLQLQMKLRNAWDEFSDLVARLGEIADTRHTTQVAVVADCQAASFTRQGDCAAAREACVRFNAAIEAAGEPPIERWPHFITEYQLMLAEGRADEAARWLGARLPLFDGGVRLRTEACVALARAEAASDTERVPRLREALALLKAADWTAAWANLPLRLAQLCADALSHGIEPAFCTRLVLTRRLQPPASRPPAWPWPFRIQLLGTFRIERGGQTLPLGPKPPALSLDLLRALAVARDQACSLTQLHDWFWPDADGDRAKAACEQALHRLRRLLGEGEFVLQREGVVRLAPEAVWVDLPWWERRLEGALADEGIARLQQALADFPGPLLPRQAPAPWWEPAARRWQGRGVDAFLQLARGHARHGDHAAARAACLRGRDAFPDAPRLREALARLAAGGDP